MRYYIAPIINRRGNVSSLIINVQDLTRPKEVEISKFRSELKYRMLVENSLQAMLIIQQGKLIFGNSMVEEISQYKIKELKEKNSDWLKVLIYPEDYKRVLKNISSALSGEKVAARNEYRYIRKDGRIRWVESLGSIVDYNNKAAILVVAIDITERKEAETILIKSEEQLRQANAMKDKFFSIIAHDLKNPFNAILGYSNLLFEAYDNFDEKQRKTFIKDICEASENTFKLLQNLLEWSRTQTGNIDFNPQLVDLSQIIDENITVLKSAANNKKITLQTELSPRTNVFADENMIMAVVRNLLSNAIKFTHPQGRVYITSKNSKNIVEVCVADTGVGLSKVDLKRLFRIDDPFKTLGTNKEQGSGLGLILCKEFVEKNGGKIWAESELGKGSKFKFTLQLTNMKIKEA